MKELHLIANAHIDPVWQWNWQEGVGAALSTFAVAADLCEEYPGFVFNHNEALLYEWTETYDPALFARIRRLVQAGRWHIMGGWYLQPDCNLPCGESLLRQIRAGRRYFKEKFGVVPETAASLDAFGHSRGLVQLLELTGYRDYLFMRGTPGLPEVFCWQGYAGSRVTAVRMTTCYNTPLGKSAEAIRASLDALSENGVGFRLWGVGNHGGGPSRQDLDALGELQRQVPDRLIHSTPEAYTETLRGKPMPVLTRDLGPVFVGTYTTMQRVKRAHRRLEGQLYTAEAMALLAQKRTGLPYPQEQLEKAERELLFCQFHDILPGTCVESAEENALMRLHTGLRLAEGCIFDSMAALCRDEKPAQPGDTPVFVFQPLPVGGKAYVECEFMLPDQNWSDEVTNVTVRFGGRTLPAQVLKEESNLSLDWRKRIGVVVPLVPMGMARLDISLKRQKPPLRAAYPLRDRLMLTTEWGRVTLDPATGALNSLTVSGRELIRPGFARLTAYTDSEDPWSMEETALGHDPRPFKLLAGEALTQFVGREGISAVTVTEEGDVLTRVQVLLGDKTARACVQYTVFRELPFVDVDVRLYAGAPHQLYRMAFPVSADAPEFYGQDICGARFLEKDGQEQSTHSWTAATAGGQWLLGVINDSSGGVCVRDGQLMSTLMRTPVYVAHPITGRPLLSENSFLPHADMGARQMRFRLVPAPPTEAALDAAAQSFNTPPVTALLFPRGGGTAAQSLEITGARLMSLHPAADGSSILRVLRAQAEDGTVTVFWPEENIRASFPLRGYQVQTLRVCGGQCTPCDPLE